MNKLLLFVTLALMCFGIAVVYSISAPVAVSKNLSPEYFLMKHLYKVVASVIIIGVFYKIDYALWKDSSRVIFGVGALLTFAAIISGGEVKGASRWIFGIQPSELMKFGFICWICAKLSNAGDEIKSIKCTIIQPAVPFLISAILLALQPNYSMLLMFCALLLTLLIIAGANYKYVLISFLSSLPLLAIALLCKSHTRKRIKAYLANDGSMKESNILLKRLAMVASWERGLAWVNRSLVTCPKPIRTWSMRLLAKNMVLSERSSCLSLLQYFSRRATILQEALRRVLENTWLLRSRLRCS